VTGDGDAITESEPVYTSVQLRPTFCAAYTKYNYRVGLQTGGGVENIIRSDLMAQIAAEIDNQAFTGDGTSNKITGIINVSGINTHTYTSSPQAVQWSDVVELEKLLIDDLVPLDNCHYVAGSTCYKLLKTVSRAGTEAIFLADFMGQRPTLNGYPLHVSTHVPTNGLIFGNFSELLVGDWGAIALASDPFTDFAKGTTGIRAFMPVDLAVRHAVSFAVAS
jgi:HK97 family phage major capsid protein